LRFWLICHTSDQIREIVIGYIISYFKNWSIHLIALSWNRRLNVLLFFAAYGTLETKGIWTSVIRYRYREYCFLDHYFFSIWINYITLV
jgi:multisubunit Na+/H+ antiporter MnhE subunit